MSVEPASALADFARAHGFLAPDETGVWKALTGGVSSDIWRLRAKRGEVCIKRALPKLKTADSWLAPVERNGFEWRYMEEAERIVPGCVPTPLAHDPQHGLFAMAWLPPERYALWKTELFAGRIDAAFAGRLGELLGRIHAATSSDQTVAARFATDSAFHALRIDPYLLTTARRHGDLATILRAIAMETATTKRVLVHGDVSPKNILVGAAGPVLLDAECAWFGDPAFDLAFCLSHLAIKARLLADHRVGLSDAFDRLAESYLGCVAWEPRQGLERRAARLLPALALARLDGKSPVDYLDSTAAQGLREAARRALLAASPTLSAAKALLLAG